MISCYIMSALSGMQYFLSFTIIHLPFQLIKSIVMKFIDFHVQVQLIYGDALIAVSKSDWIVCLSVYVLRAFEN